MYHHWEQGQTWGEGTGGAIRSSPSIATKETLKEEPRKLPLVADRPSPRQPFAVLAVVVVVVVRENGRVVVTTETTSVFVRRCVHRYRAGPSDMPWTTLTTCSSPHLCIRYTK